MFLAENKYNSLDDFSLVSELEYEPLPACPEDTARVEKAVAENVLGVYLTAEKIAEMYSFDRTYSSALESAKWQIEQEKNTLATDRNYTRAKKYADSELSALIAEAEQKLFARLDKIVEQCQHEDKENIERISTEYSKHLDAADEEVKALHDEAGKAKNEHLDSIQKKLAERMHLFERIETEDKINIIEAHKQEKESERSDLIQRKTEIEENYASLKGLQKHTSKIMVDWQLSNLDAKIRSIESDIAAISDVSMYDLSVYRRNNPLCAFRQLQRMTMDVDTVSAGFSHTVGLKADGTVVAVGDNDDGQCDVSNWTDIVAVSAGGYHTVGLKADGTVVAVGYNDNGQCNVSYWTDIVAVSAGTGYTVGLKADGTVVAVGRSDRSSRCDVDDWTDIIAVSAGDNHTVGLKADGTVVAVGYSYYGACDVTDWTDIVAISAGDEHTVGLKADGTVVATEYTGRSYGYKGQCDVSGWTDIVAVSAGDNHTVGLKADGTVVAVGDNDDGQCDVNDWTDIVAISAGSYHTVGLKADGTVVSTECISEYFNDGQCNVGDWADIKVPKNPEITES